MTEVERKEILLKEMQEATNEAIAGLLKVDEAITRYREGGGEMSWLHIGMLAGRSNVIQDLLEDLPKTIEKALKHGDDMADYWGDYLEMRPTGDVKVFSIKKDN